MQQGTMKNFIKAAKLFQSWEIALIQLGNWEYCKCSNIDWFEPTIMQQAQYVTNYFVLRHVHWLVSAA